MHSLLHQENVGYCWMWDDHGSAQCRRLLSHVTRAPVLRDPTVPGGIGELGAIHAVAPALGLDSTPIDVRNAGH